MMKLKNMIVCVFLLSGLSALYAQDESQAPQNNFERAAESVQKRLADSVAELNRLREQVIQEKIPLSRRLSELENKLTGVRLEYQQTTRLLDSRTLDLNNLRNEIKSRREETSYLTTLLGEYMRNFESRLHITELQRYAEPLEAAKLAMENSGLTEQEIFQAQAALLTASLDRLEDALGGTRFKGKAVDTGGLVKPGTVILVGPIAIFQSDDALTVGAAEQRLGSLEPAVIPFGSPADAEAAANVIAEGTGLLPLDPTLGNAHKVEQTQETFLEHIEKGGPVMYPIFALAGAALLVALYKWIFLAFLRKPSDKQINELLAAVARKDEKLARDRAVAIRGPAGEMLTTAVDHLKEPRELIEEVMYEKVLSTRLKLQRFLPFISVSAASAPLLGLLGTVTGIIQTFKLITVFGSGDVKMLSGGISEALITTEFGLIVAIPSLLVHAFLSRKARGVIDSMEKSAVAFVNQVSKTSLHQFQPTEPMANNPVNHTSPANPDPEAMNRYSKDLAGGLMNPCVFSVGKSVTVAEAIDKIRDAGIGENVDAVFIVDEQGKYVGYLLIRQLITHPGQSSVESLATKFLSVRVDTHKEEIHNLFRTHDLNSMPVLDYDDRLVGLITRNGNGK